MENEWKSEKKVLSKIEVEHDTQRALTEFQFEALYDQSSELMLGVESDTARENDAKSWTSAKYKNCFDLIWLCPIRFFYFANYSKSLGGTRSWWRPQRTKNDLISDSQTSNIKDRRFEPLKNESSVSEATSTCDFLVHLNRSNFLFPSHFDWNDMHVNFAIETWGICSTWLCN